MFSDRFESKLIPFTSSHSSFIAEKSRQIIATGLDRTKISYRSLSAPSSAKVISILPAVMIKFLSGLMLFQMIGLLAQQMLKNRKSLVKR